MFLAGMWCSSSKPPTTECLMPILQELESLSTVGMYKQYMIAKQVLIVFCVLGVKVSVQGEGDVVCRAKLLFVVADLPAKASLLNMTQFNGKFGCPTCYPEGQQVCISQFSFGTHLLPHTFVIFSQCTTDGITHCYSLYIPPIIVLFNIG